MWKNNCIFASPTEMVGKTSWTFEKSLYIPLNWKSRIFSKLVGLYNGSLYSVNHYHHTTNRVDPTTLNLSVNMVHAFPSPINVQHSHILSPHLIHYAVHFPDCPWHLISVNPPATLTVQCGFSPNSNLELGKYLPFHLLARSLPFKIWIKMIYEYETLLLHYLLIFSKELEWKSMMAIMASHMIFLKSHLVIL